jgi:hypothetical protein
MNVPVLDEGRAGWSLQDSGAAPLNKMSMGRYRHIPVKKADGTYSVTSIKQVIKYIAKAEW